MSGETIVEINTSTYLILSFIIIHIKHRITSFTLPILKYNMAPNNYAIAPSNLPSTKKKLDIRDYLGKIEKVLPTSAGEIVMILVTLCLYREEN